MTNLSITLYHFTNRPNLELILEQETIKAGSYLNGKEIKHGLISLTTDLDPQGHGLQDGREISGPQVKQLKYATERSGKCYSVDNTEFCIRLSLSQSNVISARSVHNQAELLILELTAHLPCSKNVTPADLATVASQIRSGVLVGKSSTWWYHRGDLKLTQFELLHKQPAGTYSPVPKKPTGEPDLSSIPVEQIFEYP